MWVRTELKMPKSYCLNNACTLKDKCATYTDTLSESQCATLRTMSTGDYELRCHGDFTGIDGTVYYLISCPQFLARRETYEKE